MWRVSDYEPRLSDLLRPLTTHSVFPRATGALLAWMAAVGWMGNQEPLVPLGRM